jgi:O-methyltransferase
MASGSATRRIQRMDAIRRASAATIHGARKTVTPSLRGQAAHSTLISTATYSPWLADQDYLAFAAKVADYTLLDEMRLYELWQLAAQVGHLEGDAIEVGCWRGGAGCLIAHRLELAAQGSTMFLCDTFTGVVKAGGQDSVYRGGEHADADAGTVERLVRGLRLTGVDILVGIFPEDSGDAVAERRFKFTHIDVDVYEGARDAFAWLFPRLVVGAIAVFDDYGSSATDGIRTFIDELQGHPDLAVVRNLNGQAVVVKRSATRSDLRLA